MRYTTLDHLVTTCIANGQNMPMYHLMGNIISAARPAVHLWQEKDPLQVGLPPGAIEWPDSAMCLCVLPAITPGYHRFCVDVGSQGPHQLEWFENLRWSLEALLIFQLDPSHFDVIPLARQIGSNMTVLPEVQLHFALDGNKWCWIKSNTGPVNTFFHNVLIRAMGNVEPEEEVSEAIAYLGNVSNLCLGTYLQRLRNPGTWTEQEPKDPKFKIKNGKPVKLYRSAMLGYKEYKLKE